MGLSETVTITGQILYKYTCKHRCAHQGKHKALQFPAAPQKAFGPFGDKAGQRRPTLTGFPSLEAPAEEIGPQKWSNSGKIPWEGP